ncbi:hypothetical protein [Microbacterium sp.]|uniref:hypothetical protein n=1 Tax=Microbacterium sp. TaxID=51671 RepID=UPI0039E40EB3
MSSAASSVRAAPVVHAPPSAVRVRGALAVVAGAGESPGVYARFGARIAADGYVVAVFETTDAGAAEQWLTAQEHAPRVLVGSDRGAAAVLALVAVAAAVDGAIVAGTPTGAADDAAADAAVRTACPVHLGVLGDASARASAVDPAAEPAAPVAVPDAEALASVAVPVLAIHGAADAVAPFAAARAVLGAIPALELVETVDGLHDALNDQTHRSVAATVVLWLERLRGAGVDTPIVRVVAPEARR